ncbi:MAG: glycoside hydrolase family 65 protein, partial [Armatimonadetes bacterium]|nr:glycoside hydrolase family 65 protein [Armatimonadota bacterium]
MTARPKSLLLAAGLLLTGCHRPNTPPANASAQSPVQLAQAANQAFLSQKTFDPWVLKSSGSHTSIPLYSSTGKYGWLSLGNGAVSQLMQAGDYHNGQLEEQNVASPPSDLGAIQQTLNIYQGAITTERRDEFKRLNPVGMRKPLKWPHLWQTSDVVIDGDAEAQQVTHANLFYLLSSTYPGSTWSIPPMGLSSNAYGGHIFWDADVWMLPALIVQHPDYAKPIVDYRFKLLAQAKKNARAHGSAGAEFPWESADTGREEAPPEFAKERHITADVAFAAWQYYLWTGDAAYLKREGWPLLQATAQYWTSRVTKGTDGKWHIKGVLSPDETAGPVDDDAYTNAVVRYNLQAAARAARLVGQAADPRWPAIAHVLFIPYDKARAIPAENGKPLTDRFAAKQADTLLLLHPLNATYDVATQRKMLDFYAAHTIKEGPAMTSSIEAVVAARLGLAQSSLDAFRDSYRPFERAPWDAFSEKRTTNNVYFLTGMAGCLQSILYGFAGLRVSEAGETPQGTRLAGDGVAALYADPHLPPGWGRLTIKGIRFRGKTLDLTIAPDNKLTINPAPPELG